MLPRELFDAINPVVPSGITHLGFILTDIRGRVVVSTPKGHSMGITATLPRVKRYSTESPFSGLARCITEKIGLASASAYPVGATWITPNSSTMVFAGITFEEVEQTAAAETALWCTPHEAKELISASKYAPTRWRDLAVMSALADAGTPSPYRRIFEMVHELHRMGFERLRAWPGMSPSGMHWRCSVLPASLMSSGPREEIDQEAEGQFEATFGHGMMSSTFFDGHPQEPFGWQDAHFDQPADLARKFVARKRDVACAGWGQDTEYATWFSAMLNATAPCGIYRSYADYPVSDDYLSLLMMSGAAHDLRIPPPPPGEGITSL